MAEPTARGAIAYLVQPTHSSYPGRDSLALLKQSVRLLYLHYNAVQRDDVLFFHSNPMALSMQRDVLSLCTPGTARFELLAPYHFVLPKKANRSRNAWWYPKKFSVGYRHMIRFFTLGIWPLLKTMGYTHMMRLDEDSFIWSPIKYNVFKFMLANSIDYGFRLAGWERGLVSGPQMNHFHELVRKYAVRERLSLGWLAGPCLHQSPEDTQSNYSLAECGNIWTVYNNWFVGSLDFWLRKDVQAFLRHFNSTQTIYTHRYGDALWHSVALALFAKPKRVVQFTDFAYEHATLRRHLHSEGRASTSECWTYGGVVLADRGPNWVAAEHTLAISRLANFSAAALSCGRHEVHSCASSNACLYSTLCLHAPKGRVQAILAGRVSPEQPTCDRSPAPFYCAPRPMDPSMYSSYQHELRDAKAQCWPHVRGRRGLRPRIVCQLRVAKLVEEKQLATMCANWCPLIYPNKSGVRPYPGRVCYERAQRMWEAAARGQLELPSAL